jgi:hypothetical protein
MMDRREFVGRSAKYGTTFWLLWNVPRPHALRAATQSTEPLILSKKEWQTVEAITARIIPTDHEPGAIEANCANFIDKALANEDALLLPTYREGLPGIDRVAREQFGTTFGDLQQDEQDEVLMALESGEVSGWSPESVAPVSSANLGRLCLEEPESALIWH